MKNVPEFTRALSSRSASISSGVKSGLDEFVLLLFFVFVFDLDLFFVFDLFLLLPPPSIFPRHLLRSQWHRDTQLYSALCRSLR